MAKKIVMVLGIILIIAGLLGFLSGPLLLGIFAVDIVHNLVFLVIGILAVLAATKGEANIKKFAKVFGVIYAIVAILGLVFGDDLFGIMAMNMADDILYVVLALILLYVGFGKVQGAVAPQAPTGGDMGGQPTV